MISGENAQMCSCCVDSRPLHYIGTDNVITCLASGHVYERRGENLLDTGIDTADYQRQQNYLNLEFPDEARPGLAPRERIDLSRYGYS
jgi:hypothetical protein